ncbi:unnamed protein product [Phaeothamnion confervicola]
MVVRKHSTLGPNAASPEALSLLKHPDGLGPLLEAVAAAHPSVAPLLEEMRLLDAEFHSSARDLAEGQRRYLETLKDNFRKVNFTDWRRRPTPPPSATFLFLRIGTGFLSTRPSDLCLFRSARSYSLVISKQCCPGEKYWSYLLRMTG